MVREKSEFNQYWYSWNTVETMINEIKRLNPSKTAFLSTPTLWLAAINNQLHADLFDFDDSFARMTDSDANRFVHYDFHHPFNFANGNRKYELIVIDPPFITSDVIKAYSQTSQLISESKDTAVIISSIDENLDILQKNFGSSVKPVPFRPCIPSLVYQYTLFVNYSVENSSLLNSENLELN